MQCASDIINKWPSAEDLALDLGVSENTVLSWKQRRRLPGSHDVKLVQSAEKRGISGITFELLAKLRAGVSETAQ